MHTSPILVCNFHLYVFSTETVWQYEQLLNEWMTEWMKVWKFSSRKAEMSLNLFCSYSSCGGYSCFWPAFTVLLCLFPLYLHIYALFTGPFSFSFTLKAVCLLYILHKHRSQVTSKVPLPGHNVSHLTLCFLLLALTTVAIVVICGSLIPRLC